MSLLLQMALENELFGCFLIMDSAGFSVLSMRQMRLNMFLLICSWQRYIASSVLGAVVSIKFCQSIWSAMNNTAGT